MYGMKLSCTPSLKLMLVIWFFAVLLFVLHRICLIQFCNSTISNVISRTPSLLELMQITWLFAVLHSAPRRMCRVHFSCGANIQRALTHAIPSTINVDNSIVCSVAFCPVQNMPSSVLQCYASIQCFMLIKKLKKKEKQWHTITGFQFALLELSFYCSMVCIVFST